MEWQTACHVAELSAAKLTALKPEPVRRDKVITKAQRLADSFF